jgi:hypothetical protein
MGVKCRVYFLVLATDNGLEIFALIFIDDLLKVNLHRVRD